MSFGGHRINIGVPGGWHKSRLGFFTLSIGELYLGPLGNAHHLSLASIATNELVVG